MPGYNGKNRTFFFADYQGTRIRTAQTFLATLAPAPWRTGDFCGFNTILDPDTTHGSRFPVIRFPTSVSIRHRQKLIALDARSECAGFGRPPGVANNYLTNPVEPNNTDQGDVRIDHRISDKDSMFARFSMSDQILTPPAAIPPPLSAAQLLVRRLDRTTRATACSPKRTFFRRDVVNEFRAGYTRLRTERLQFNSAENLSAQIGFPVAFRTRSGNGGLPRFDVSGPQFDFGSATYPADDVSLRMSSISSKQ